MTIPPFPAQDLAKLVLGYLAEEQLMTAYDEFLQASPYLDAMKNEYDRIFMTSLKCILAEYRAVKILVETCKPVALRRRLYGCANLLDVMKFLVQHVDVAKLGSDSSVHKLRAQAEQKMICEGCDSRLSNCVCKGRHSLQYGAPSTSAEIEVLDTSVETTSLNDLPGNHATVKRKQAKVLERDKIPLSQSTCNSSIGDPMESSRNQSEGASTNPSTHSSQNIDNTLCNTSACAAETMDSSQKLEEFNDILNKLCNKSTGSNLTSGYLQMQIGGTHKIPYFETGVTAKTNGNVIANLPDSSTSENYNDKDPLSKEKYSSNNTVANNLKEVAKTHILCKVGTVKNPPCHLTYAGKIKPKPVEQKVTILSDIKVDKQFSRDSSPMPEVLRNATPTPVMRMQTILINGTPAFTQVHQNHDQSKNFTKDEIMAMPTIIIVPNSSTETSSIQSQAQSTVPPTNTIMSSVRPLRQLVMDMNPLLPKNNDLHVEKQNESIEQNTLLKTVHGKNFSLPKDSVITTESSDVATPLVQPPVRKSSSTPRRTSHVRVLDFATPRRILDDTMDERGETADNIATDVVCMSTETSTTKDTSEQNLETLRDQQRSEIDVIQENNNSSLTGKKLNWDESLRALAIANNDGFEKIIPICQRKTKQSSKRDKSTANNKKKTPKGKKRHSDRVTVEPVTLVPDIIHIPVKPTINIVTGHDRSVPDTNKIQYEQNKSNEETNDTPEMDRTSLQNIIGAKLNISELLETPYKQAIYDIQMETPRFLGPDLPGEPLSDIKISSIPTPRFLSSPKQNEATPSAYSSRPTDYSSGGSYYKPDDQDYLVLDEIGYPKQPTANSENPEGGVEFENERNVKTRSSTSRPVRKCTKNVSYYNSPAMTRPKEASKDTAENKADAAYSCSDTMSINSSFEFEKESKCTKTITKKKVIKSDARVKKRKTPIKKDTPKSFMKIKPRRSTPTKDSTRKNKRKISESQPRKRTSSKDMFETISPAIISAPPKSRRKSSTPRKLECTKTFNLGGFHNSSPDHSKRILNIQNKNDLHCVIEKPQRCSDDDGSKNADSKELHTDTSVMNDSEDINKIKEFIATSEVAPPPGDLEHSLHQGLVKRGFDVETAKIIERDLLDAPLETEIIDVVGVDTETTALLKQPEVPLERTAESSAASSTLQIVQDDEDDESDDIELTVHECNEDTANYIVCNHDETEKMPKSSPVPLKDKYCMEVCIDDDVTIKLRATPFTVLLDDDPIGVKIIDYSYRETELAVSSISNIDKLYTPLKESIKAQCYEIFDSTLTSLDTPLKATSPKVIHETNVAGIVLEVEEIEETERDSKKRKRCISSEEEGTNEHKKTKPEAQYLLNPANIQNIDIESVLCKLHGP